MTKAKGTKREDEGQRQEKRGSEIRDEEDISIITKYLSVSGESDEKNNAVCAHHVGWDDRPGLQCAHEKGNRAWGDDSATTDRS